jgi:hypothetical protein
VDRAINNDGEEDWHQDINRIESEEDNMGERNDDMGGHHDDENNDDARDENQNDDDAVVKDHNDDSHIDDDDVSKGGIKSTNNPTLDVPEILENPNGTEGTDMEEPSVSDDVLHELTEMGTFQRDDSASLVLSDLLHRNEVFRRKYAMFTSIHGGMKTDWEPSKQLSNGHNQKRKYHTIQPLYTKTVNYRIIKNDSQL